VPPGVGITSSQERLKAGETATLTFRLTEDSVDFTATDVSVSGGVLDQFSGAGAVYTARFTPTAASTAPGSISVAAAKFTDAAGNDNTASNTVSIAIDSVLPTATLGALPASQPTPVTSLAVTFSKPMSGLVIGDFALTRNGVPVALAGVVVTGSGTSWLLSGLGTATAPSGYYVLTLRSAGAVRDLAGNALAANATRLWTCTPFPTPVGLASITQSSVTSITIKFNGMVTGFDKSDIRLTVKGWEVSLRKAQLTGSGDTYVLSGLDRLTSGQGRYELTIGGPNHGITDAAGIAMVGLMQTSWQRVAPPSPAGGRRSAR
jgi:hypothetical protein